MQVFEWQQEEVGISTYVDSDWAGDRKTCKSTSGGMIFRGSHLLKSWSTNQQIIALSSGEAELYAQVKGAAQTLGMISMAADFGECLSGTVYSDSSAALGIVTRSGLGKVRHIRVQYLWLQERVAQSDLAVRKVAGETNPADLLTKGLAQELLKRHTKFSGIEVREPAVTAPKGNSAALCVSERRLRGRHREGQPRYTAGSGARRSGPESPASDGSPTTSAPPPGTKPGIINGIMKKRGILSINNLRRWRVSGRKVPNIGCVEIKAYGGNAGKGGDCGLRAAVGTGRKQAGPSLHGVKIGEYGVDAPDVKSTLTTSRPTRDVAQTKTQRILPTDADEETADEPQWECQRLGLTRASGAEVGKVQCMVCMSCECEW